MTARHSTPIGDNSFASTFLRGGQIFMHNARMYAQLFSRLFSVCVLLTFGIALMVSLTFAKPLEARLFGSRSVAWFYTWIEQSDREMSIIDENQEIVHMQVFEVLENRFIQIKSDAFLATAMRNFAIAGFIGFMILAFLMYWFISHGKRLGSDTHLRGAQVIDGKELAIEIYASNHAAARRFKIKKYRPYSLVGIPYAFRAETTHTLLVGTTGSGKTQAMAPLLSEIRARGDRAIIYDKMRAFVPAFFDKARGDVILNPLDDRCPEWSPFHDGRSLEDFRQMAAALMPDPGSSDPFWVESARVVFAVTAHKLYRANRRTNKDLLDLLLRAPLASLSTFLKNTIAGSLIDDTNPRTSQSIRATLTTSLASLQVMERTGIDRASFSIRQWIEDEDSCAFLFMTSRSDKHETLRGLITLWMELAMNSIMAQDRDPDRTIWLFLDELPSLFKLPSLEKGLAEGRQFGAAYVLGIQTLSQLESIYRKDVAHTITGLARTKLILNLADPDTAETAAKYIGREEVQRAQRGVGFGAHQTRDGVNYTVQDKFDHLVLPEQLMRLPNLAGYLVPAGTFPTARVAFNYTRLAERTLGFVERSDDYDELDGLYADEAESELAASRTPWAGAPSAETAGQTNLPAAHGIAIDDGQADAEGETAGLLSGGDGEGGLEAAHTAQPVSAEPASAACASVGPGAHPPFFNFQSEAHTDLDPDNGR
tara:strand:+ start:42325 stop:44451 length:2127 start_codon:yes stop_codon:yes gene_type:complete